MNQTLENGRSHLLTDNLGTRGYKAPEIKKSTNLLSSISSESTYKLKEAGYRGDTADVFSLGVILFIIVVGHPPFNDVDSNDIAYKHLEIKDYNSFWVAHFGEGYVLENKGIDKGLKNLIE